MDKVLQEIAENIDKYTIDLDDEFRFKCRCCGKCCRNRDDILLSPQDVFKITKKLELSVKEFIKKYCEVYIGYSSYIPIVRLFPKGANKVCPLLNNNLCMVHEVKPTVCALFPLGRIATIDDKKINNTIKTRYILQYAICASLKYKHTVRSWLNQFNIPIDDIFFYRWNELRFLLSNFFQDNVKSNNDLSKKTIEQLWNLVFYKLYIDYDNKVDFLPQFEKNSLYLEEIISEINKKSN